MKLNRRNFLFGSAAAVTFAGHATAKTGLRELKPGEKRTIAMIGCGIQQRATLIPQFLDARNNKTLKIVAVCDCDKTRAAAAAKRVNGAYKNNDCRIVADFRDIIKDPSIDAVCIATPDHWHAYICVEAMKHGKDVYCEKPLTYSVEEARQVIAAQAKYGRVFQTGSMQRSWREFRDAVMVVRNGFIGDVKYVDANYGQAGSKHGGTTNPMRFFDNPKNAAKEGAPNPDIDWNMWLGPSRWRPYSDQLAPRGAHRFFPMFWRMDDELASGMNGDWGAHHLDIAQWGIDMDKSGPYRAICSTEPYSTDLYLGGRRQYGMKMLFKAPHGDIELKHGPFGVWGTVFYGTDGIVAVNRGKIAVWQHTGPVVPTPEIRAQLEKGSFMPDKIVAISIGRDYGKQAQRRRDNRLADVLGTIEKTFDLANAKVQVYKSQNQVANFVQCIETRNPTICPAEVGGRSATLCQICNLSYKYDTGFDWDPERMCFANGTGHGIPLGREFCRDGWKIEV